MLPWYVHVTFFGVVGLIAAIWPTVMFVGSTATPDQKNVRTIRRAGVTFLLISVFVLVLEVVDFYHAAR